MKTKPKIFISVPDDRHLDEHRKLVKRGIANLLILKELQPVGFEQDQFGIKGLKKSYIEWTFEKANKIIRECDGMIIIGLARTFFSKINFSKYESDLLSFSEKQKEALKQLVITGNKQRAAKVSGLSESAINDLVNQDTIFWKTVEKIRSIEKEEAARHGSNIDVLATQYNHVEGAIALSKGLPICLIRENGVERSGIFSSGIRPFVISDGHSLNWINETEFDEHIESWKKDVSLRRDVFLGYCSKANSSAIELRDFIEAQGFTVLDWARDFKKAGKTILEEIERAATLCRCAIFLFTKDDELDQNITAKASYEAVPRDNVLAETGYFMRNLGKERVAIIREKGVKMPADFGGIIYLSMEDRAALLDVKISLESFLLDALKIELI
ncbi:MAG: nucleotide-binding protein [Adhaeribacter sp.]